MLTALLEISRLGEYKGQMVKLSFHFLIPHLILVSKTNWQNGISSNLSSLAIATTVFHLARPGALVYPLTEPAQSNIFMLATVVSQMVTSKDMYSYSNPQAYECGPLIEESEFTDIIKDFEMWSYWIISAVPIFKVICFLRARQKEIYHRKKTEKEEKGHRKTRQRLELFSHKSKECLESPETERRGRILA